MPGRRLNDNERHLLQLWENPPAGLRRPLLRSIEISGGTGLRGIDGLIVPLRYPVTAICGINGVGKSTVLALAALAHHTPQGWFVHWGNTGPRRSGGDRTYYTFSDFFVHGHDDTPASDVSVTWRYYWEGQETHKTFTKKGTKWGRYTGRLEREVDFLPIGRILPGYEMRGVRSTFLKPSGRVHSAPLDDEFRQILSSILVREYSQAEVQESKKYTFQRCHAEVPYTAFNMGAGEVCMISLLYLLQKIPQGGLLVVEEIEAGLHPQAQVRLAQALIKICLQKHIQVICSTHSEMFLDALPRQARLLMRRSGDEHSVIESPSTRFAVYEMTGVAQPELIIYCEDKIAAILIEEALSHELRLRVRIQHVGSDATVIRQGVSHIRTGLVVRTLCILDGDCSEGEIDKWIASERGERDEINLDYLILPGDGLPPERWVAEQLRHEAYRDELARQLNCPVPDAQNYIEALRVELDHRDIGYVLHQRTNLDQTDCIRRTMRAVAPRHPQLEDLREKVATLLDG